MKLFCKMGWHHWCCKGARMEGKQTWLVNLCTVCKLKKYQVEEGR